MTNFFDKWSKQSHLDPCQNVDVATQVLTEEFFGLSLDKLKNFNIFFTYALCSRNIQIVKLRLDFVEI